MQKASSIAEMLKFYFGRKVFCSDGEEGFLVNTVFDREPLRLGFIGVQIGRFFGKTVYVPFDAIAGASGERVTLTMSRAELAQSSTAVPGGALVDSRAVVRLKDTGKRGTLLLVATQPHSGELAYIVAHHLRPNMDTLIRRDFVTQIDPARFTVSISEQELEALPPYRSDEELQREVEEVLYEVGPLHVDYRGMTIRVLDGVLYLEGNISSSLRSDIVRSQASGVPGLLDIEDHLIGDDTLASAVADALARDARTRGLPIGVYPKLGTVRISGAVHNGQQKETAGEIASKVHGVRSVVNDLVVDSKATMLNVMASAEGGEAIDIIPGKYIRHTK
jgi:osmotically-inducible protein OsmY